MRQAYWCKWHLLTPFIAGWCVAIGTSSDFTDFSSKVHLTLSDVYPCTKLLNRTGSIGCESSHPKVSGTLRQFDSLADLQSQVKSLQDSSERTVIVLGFPLFADDEVLKAADSAKPAGILVLAPDGVPPVQFSPEVQNPQQETGLYPNDFHSWNPAGTGRSHRFFPYPIFLVGKAATPLIIERCRLNHNQSYKFPRWSAELVLTMQAQTPAVGQQATSVSCLQSGSCMPQSGQTVFAILEKTNATSKETVLAAASMDSTSFFHGNWNQRNDQLSPGGGAEISGAVAVVAAARALGFARETLEKPILFSIFSAEVWGRLGSRRFLSTPPCWPSNKKGWETCMEKSRISTAIGVGGISKEASQVYIHVDTARNPGAGTFQEQLITGAGAGVLIKATTSPPRLPPNPVESIVHDSALAGAKVAVLAGFNTEFSSKYYHSVLDGRDNAPDKEACNLATALARSLHVASQGLDKTSTITADCDFVSELLDCLLKDFACELAQQILGQYDLDGTPPHYTKLRESPNTMVSPLEQFFRDLLANETSVLRSGAVRVSN
jgi:hypothetical protein